MRRTGFGLALGLTCALATPVAAVNATQELLQAPRVKKYVSVAVGADGKALKYTLDDQRLEETADPKVPISAVANGNVGFLIVDFNPLTMRVKLDDRHEDEPNLTALSSFADAVRKGLDDERAATLAAALPDSALGLVSQPALASTQLSRKISEFKSGEDKQCGDASLAQAIELFNEHLTRARLTQDVLDEWAQRAVGREGIHDAAKDIQTQRASLKSSLAMALEHLAWVDARSTERLRGLREAVAVDRRRAVLEAELAGALQGEKAMTADEQRKLKVDLDAARRRLVELRDQKTGECDVRAAALMTLFYRTQPHREMERARAILEQLGQWASELKHLSDDDQRWISRRDRRGDGYFMVTTRTNENQITLSTLTVERRAPKLLDEGLALESSDVTASLTLRLRERSMFAFEVVPALVTSFVREPAYVLGAGSGDTKVVARGATQDRDFKGAVMLNAVCRCWGKTQLYPMFQFGITPDSSVPALFLGGGFRFLRPNGLSLSFGAVVTRVKDLDRLRVGDVVADQAAIDVDLKERARVKMYIAVQFRF